MLRYVFRNFVNCLHIDKAYHTRRTEYSRAPPSERQISDKPSYLAGDGEYKNNNC